MPTRNVVLTDQQTEFIKRLVSSDRYQNTSEVLREGIRLIDRQELENEAHLKVLREAAKIGIADMECGLRSRGWWLGKTGPLARRSASSRRAGRWQFENHLLQPGTA